jgi:D-alanyl-D-alanine carboxypeptidase
LTAEFDGSPAFRWLQANAAAFGFKMPYGHRNRFGFDYEPWHWSQVDTEVRRRKNAGG